MKYSILFIISCLIFLGCETTLDRMETWLGSEEHELMSSWGAPDRTIESGDKRIHTWDDRNGYGEIICTKTFTVDSKGIIISATTSFLSYEYYQLLTL